MDSFVVSARKYRPVTFDTVIGQNSITGTLKNAIKNNHLAQSFLFCGPRGVGKTTCARILAKTINCENLSENIEACNVCPSCDAFNKSASFNVHELDAASNNTVDGIRALIDQVRIPPQAGKYKIYIIDEVHMLSSQAFNAFLKTLEEPPAYAKFILATTEKHKIIPTILSRCQIYDFARITIEDIAKHLQFVAKSENVEADYEALHIISQKADGALRDALSIFDQMVSFSGEKITYEDVIDNLNVLDFDYYFKMTDHILQGNTSSVLLLIDEIIAKGFEGSHFIIGFGEHLRNLLVCRNPETVKLIDVSDSIRQRYLNQSNQCKESFLLQALVTINQCDLDYKAASNKRLMLELALLNLATLSYKKPESGSQPEKKNVDNPEVTTASVSQTKSPDIVKAPGPTEKISSHKPEPKNTEPPASPSSKPFSISIKESNAEDEKKNPNESESIDDVSDLPAEEFSSHDFKQAWDKLTAKYKNKNHTLHLALTKNEPVLKSNNIELLLDNTIQDEEIKEKKIELLSFLRKQLNNYSIRISTKIVENKTVAKKAYLPEEKISLMIEKKPEIQRLIDDLDLEIKH